MNVEVIAIGTELLLGQIVNTNLATIGRALAEAGLDTYRQVVVGDNLERLSEAIREGLAQSDAIILTGGIGPTQDDITREGICEATGLEMAYDEEYATHLEEWWAARGREMPTTNYKQAEHPGGASLIPNPKGTAPGLDIDFERQADLRVARRAGRDGHDAGRARHPGPHRLRWRRCGCAEEPGIALVRDV